MEPDSISAPPPITPPRRLNWLLMLALLLAPALLTCLSVLVDKSSNGPAPGVALIAGALGGIGAGILLGRYMGRTDATKILLSVVFSAVCAVASITLSTFGCLASGYSLNFH